jgi:glycosyltransferase involved in cell wall biosynthesis
VRKLIYLYPKRFAFVAKDIDALSTSFTVLEHRFDRGGKWLLPWSLLCQFLWLLRVRRDGGKQAIVHFAGYHALLPILLGFRTHIIVAGSDACSFPAINYGNFRKRILAQCIAFTMRHARTVLPVHASLASFQNTYSDLGPVDQGFCQFVTGLRTPIQPVAYGFDAAFWATDPAVTAPRDGVLCIAAGARPGDAVFFRKGLDLILSAAKELPNVKFTIVGVPDPSAYSPTTNVEVIGKVGPDLLKELLGACSIYCQPSVMEGFPNALCEAMLMGCLPLVSSVTSMPDIVEGLGKVIPQRDHQLLREGIVALLTLPGPQVSRIREQARQRIASRYPAELRLSKLADLID